MNQTNQTPASIYKSISILTAALVAGASLMLLFVHFAARPTVQGEENRLFMMIVAIMATMGYFVGGFIYRKRIATIRDQSGLSLNQQMTEYMSATILRFAMLEGPTLLAIVFYFLEGHYQYTIIAIGMIAIMLLSLPKKEKIGDELNLNSDERNQLNAQAMINP